MKTINHLKKLLFTAVVVISSVYAPTALAQEAIVTSMPINHAPLNPDRPDFIDLEVAAGTTKIKVRTFQYNHKEKKYTPIELITTSLNEAGMVTYQRIENLVEFKDYQTTYKTYDSLNRVTKSATYYITNNDTLPSLTTITYSGTNPLIASWNNDTETLHEKMYFDANGVVIKKEIIETLEDVTSITSIATYDSISQKGTFTGYYPEGGSEDFALEYKNGKLIKENITSEATDFISQIITYDEKGSKVLVRKRYVDTQREVTYLEKQLTYQDGQWVAAIHDIDDNCSTQRGTVCFIFREITSKLGTIKPSKEQGEAVYKALEFPKSKSPW
jgi:hypothetical protein